MLAPKCPICGRQLQYDLIENEWYDDQGGATTYSIEWLGFCETCDLDFRWTEIFTLTKILGPELSD